jgi:pimeloyl-ACP methyl ester carboxylesterase
VADASGYVPVNGIEMYWESTGRGGTPLIIAHGGFMQASLLGDLPAHMAANRRVIAVEMQGHGHTADTDRPLSLEAFGDDIAGLVRYLELGKVDLVGYSLGAGASLRAAIQHPELVDKLVVISFPCKRDGWFPEVRAGFDQMSRGGFDQMKQSFLYSEYLKVAPDPDAFPTMMDKMGEMFRRPYDWCDEVAGLTCETMLMFADADSISTEHIAEFYGLLGGGLRDAGWDSSTRTKSRLAVLPGKTHYDMVPSDAVISPLESFLG